MNCLDSAFVIDFLDPEATHHKQAVAWMEANRDGELAVPAICAFEVVRGVSRADEERYKRAVGLLRTFSILDLSLQMVLAAGDLDNRLHEDGVPLSARDTLVATPVVEHGGRLVTRDSDFNAVDGLQVDFYDE